VAVYIISLMQEVIKEIKAFIEKTIVLTITVANRNVMLVASNSYGLYKDISFKQI
jgi:tetrahydromethanopterin S-methyltransferase subunit E